MDLQLPDSINDQDTQGNADAVLAVELRICCPIQQATTMRNRDVLPSTGAPNEKGIKIIQGGLGGVREKVEQQFKTMVTQLAEGADRQEQMVTASDTLVDSPRIALQALLLFQTRLESAMAKNESQLAQLRQKILSFPLKIRD